LGPAAAAIIHQATNRVPKYNPAPVMRWTIDIIIVTGQR